MKKAYLTFIQTILTFVLMFGMQASLNPAMAQETNELDSIEVIDENSSAFNDSVQFDDMEPVFYEAADDEEATTSESSGYGSIVLYAGIAVALVFVLIVLRKSSKRKR
jgi:hypothetical protein